MTKKFKRHVAIMLSTLILLGGNGRVLADDRGSNPDGNPTESIYYGNGFKVEFNLKEHWDTGYNANVKITNTSDEIIENWALGFNFSGEISNIWNAKIVEALNDKEAGKDDANENNTSDLNPIVIKNDVWNQDILPESSVEFGFSGSGAFNGFPTKYHILGEKRLADPEDYYVEYSLSSDWGSGFNSSIMISNVSDKDIEDWILEFDFEREITNIWNGTIPSCKEGHYVIKNSGYNSIIYSKHNIQFGFSGCNGDANIVPTDYKLYYYDLTKEKSDNEEQKHSETSSFQGDNNSNPVENEKEEINTENNQEEKHSDDAKSIDNGQHDDPDKEEQNNPIEEIDKTKDTDNDGLTNLKELEINIDPSYPDSDEDGLKDGEEINTYNTDPCKYDTDGDKVSDGKEIELGTDPLTYNEKFEVTVMSEDEDTVKASVKISLTGKQVNTLSVNRFNNDFLFPEDMPGYIGGAYDFKVEGEFDQATLCFEFDEALLDEENFDPVIFYFNEEWQSLEELETKVEGNVATAKTTHFSKYILLNRNFYKPSIFDWVDELTESTNINREIMFCIDDSGFIKNADPDNRRLEIAEKIINDSDTRTKIGILKYDSNEIMLSDGLVSCDENGKELLKSCLKFDDSVMSKQEEKYVFNSKGGAFLYCGIDKALEQFNKENDDQTAKILIILTSGDAADWLSHNGMKNTLARSGVTTYVIRFIESEAYANGIEGSDMKALAECTGGREFEILKDDNLDNLYEELFKGIEIALDSDNDGIPDVYEDGLVLFNGCSIKLNKNNPDTDGDGLLDGEEIVITINGLISDEGNKVTVIGKAFSDPRKVDSDGDGEEDATDPTPLNPQLNELLCNNIERLDQLANEFLETHPLDVDGREYYSSRGDYVDEWLVFSYIRQFNEHYISDNWDLVGGKIDYRFVSYVYDEAPDLYEYFKTTPNYYLNYNGEMGDLYHLAATMSGLLYETGTFDSQIKGAMFEKNIDALCGWAGDLQTCMFDARLAVGDDASYEEYKIAMEDLVACESKEKVYKKYPGLETLKEIGEDIHFPKDDMYTDVDAVNVYKLIREEYDVSGAFRRYFKNDYKKRFSIFLDSEDKEDFKKKVYVYTQQYYLFETDLFYWTLFKKYGLTIEDTFAQAARCCSAH